MNPREKRLLVIVGCMVGLLAASKVKDAYLEKLTKLDSDIANRRKDLRAVQAEINQAALGRSEWIRTGEQTLSMDPNEAVTLLRDDLNELTRETGLTNAEVKLGQTKPWLRHGVKALNFTVRAEGSVNDIVKFLFKLDRQPYLVRCKDLTLTPVEQTTGRGNGKGPGGPARTGRLDMFARLETLVLPENKMVPKGYITTMALAKDKRPEVERTMLATVTEYLSKKGGITRDLFEPYTPPIPAPSRAAGPSPANKATVDFDPNLILRWRPGGHAKSHKVYFGEESPETLKETVTTTTYKPQNLSAGKTYVWRVDEVNESGTTEGELWSFTLREKASAPPPPPPPPAPPPDAQFVIGRILSSPRAQQVVLEEPAQTRRPNQNQQDKRVHVGEEMFGGTLIFVHPKGAVVEKSGVWTFHPVGKQLQEGRVLNEQEQPEVFNALKKLEAGAAGISRRPE